MKILITGAAGFIGFHLCKRLLKEGYNILGIDNFNNYYDPFLKKERYKYLKELDKDFIIENINIEEKNNLDKIFNIFKPEIVIHLAAQAGVRYSINNPNSYIQSNLVGFSNILEGCRHIKVKNLIYASSSSVYGGNTKMPFNERQNVDHPVSLYAASKKSNELMAHSYSHLYGIPSIGLRFFTVYGPWGRPDMALSTFTKSIIDGNPINIFGEGNMYRDFTYIDDIIESIKRLIYKPATININFDNNDPDPSSSFAPHRIFNIGNSNSIKLLDFIKHIEECLNLEARKIFLPIQPGEVIATSADCNELEKWIGFKPSTSIQDGIKQFVNWYKKFYKID